MEFARHRRRSRRSRRASSRGGAQLGRAFLALLMIAGIVYFISASAAGTWIAEKVVVPVFAMLDNYQLPSPAKENETVNPEQSAQVELNSTRKAVDVDVVLPAISCFAVQSGVYSSYDNAQSQANMLKGSGEAGYILQDGDRYRVLSSAFENEADARSLKERHTAQGRDSALYAISTNSASYRVSALEEQLNGVSAGFSAIANAQKALSSIVLKLDSGLCDAQNAQSELRSANSTLQSDMSLLCEYKGEHAALSDILLCYQDCSAAMEKAANASPSDASAFSAEIKYALLSVTDHYAKLISQLS